MLSLEEGTKAIIFSRSIIEAHIRNSVFNESELSDAFENNAGAFVTLLTFPKKELRGCIGIPEPVYTLKKAIKEASISVTRDPRFPPLNEEELNGVIIELTILTKPEIINVKKPAEYLDQIQIGRDGLIVEQGPYRGLLLPQVPVEHKWDKETFLCNTCMKAGLLPDAWADENTKIYKFTGQLFTEIKPRGKIKEKRIDGSND